MGLIRKITSVSTGGLVDFRSDKERIARYTKKSANEAKAQRELMERAIAPSAPMPMAAPGSPPATSAPGESPSLADELSKLAQLRESGALTDEEFEAAKARLLET
jgi:hypothetical protein